MPGQWPATAAGLGAAAEGVVLPWQNLPEGSVRLGAMSPLLGSTGGTEWIWGGLCLVPPISGLGRNKLSLREASRAPVGLRPSLLWWRRAAQLQPCQQEPSQCGMLTRPNPAPSSCRVALLKFRQFLGSVIRGYFFGVFSGGWGWSWCCDTKQPLARDI